MRGQRRAPRPRHVDGGRLAACLLVAVCCGGLAVYALGWRWWAWLAGVAVTVVMTVMQHRAWTVADRD